MKPESHKRNIEKSPQTIFYLEKKIIIDKRTFMKYCHVPQEDTFFDELELSSIFYMF